jgi:hypothetical protein
VPHAFTSLGYWFSRRGDTPCFLATSPEAADQVEDSFLGGFWPCWLLIKSFFQIFDEVVCLNNDA